MDPERYLASLEAERLFYENCNQVHNLPPIFHYWSNRYLRPALREFGYDGTFDVFAKHLEDVRGWPARIASIGAGNCDFEIELAQRLDAEGCRFTMECIDINTTMLERGRAAVEQANLGDRFLFTEADFNSWKPTQRYHAILANQSLHHVLNLEGLLCQVRESLADEGIFLISDMIGRNGHRRWPEALEITRAFWRELPPSYRVDRVQGHFQAEFEDTDCSAEGFEGIRAQDILPLLMEHFAFDFFFPYGNLIDPFTDRQYGENFDRDAAEDCRFIDEVHAADEAALRAGQLTPTHLIAVLTKKPRSNPRYRFGLEPARCVRRPDQPPTAWTGTTPALSFSRPADEELRVFMDRMAECREILRQREEWAYGMEDSIRKNQAWVRSVERERSSLEKQLQERTAWAQLLDAELQAKAEALNRLQKEFDERTAWALRLNEEKQTLQRELTAQSEAENCIRT